MESAAILTVRPRSYAKEEYDLALVEGACSKAGTKPPVNMRWPGALLCLVIMWKWIFLLSCKRPQRTFIHGFSLLMLAVVSAFRATQAVFLWFRIFVPVEELQQSSADRCEPRRCKPGAWNLGWVPSPYFWRWNCSLPCFLLKGFGEDIAKPGVFVRLKRFSSYFVLFSLVDKGALKLKDKFFRWLCFNAVDMVGHKRRNFLQISKKIVLFFFCQNWAWPRKAHKQLWGNIWHSQQALK